MRVGLNERLAVGGVSPRAPRLTSAFQQRLHRMLISDRPATAARPLDSVTSIHDTFISNWIGLPPRERNE
jgi:hypothetical protein